MTSPLLLRPFYSGRHVAHNAGMQYGKIGNVFGRIGNAVGQRTSQPWEGAGRCPDARREEALCGCGKMTS